MKNAENFPSSKIFWKPSCATIKSTLFTDSKDEWNTKEGTGKSMKNVLYCGMPKSTFWHQKSSMWPLSSYTGLKASGRQLVS